MKFQTRCNIPGYELFIKELAYLLITLLRNVENNYTGWGVDVETHEIQYCNLTKNIFNDLQICAIT